MIVLEKSASWTKILAGETPEALDVFLLFWIDPSTKKIVDYGSYLSTSEPGPIGTEALVVAEICVPVVNKDLVAAHRVGFDLLAIKLVHDPSLQQLFDRLKADLRDGHCKGKTKALRLPTDVVSERDFAELMRNAV